jgi:heme/copper-type cytochrome/quinol oxidase subunit 2
MSTDKNSKRAIQLPLIGLTFAWAMMMVSQYVDLYTAFPAYDDMGNRLNPEIELQWSTYITLLALVGASVASLLGQRIALAERQANDSAFALAAHRFTNLFVILSLIAGAVYAIGNFLGAFNDYDSREASPLVRIFGVYVPIILATALVVYLILAAFVFRKDAPDLPGEEKDEERAALQRAVGLAYAVPIIGTAIAIIFGLIVYDTTKTTLDVWIWVIIQAIIATSIIIGTRFAAKARGSKPLPPRPRRTGAAAVNLNLVLAIVFGAVVSIMAFAFGFSAIENLRQWPEWREGMTALEQQPIISGISFEWAIREFVPAIALLLLAVFGIYRSITTRHQSKNA